MSRLKLAMLLGAAIASPARSSSTSVGISPGEFLLPLAVFIAPAAQQEVPIETVLNGDFERRVNQIGSGAEVRGAFWIGGEGTDAGTVLQNVVNDGTGNHVLRIQNSTVDVVSQPVPLPIKKSDALNPACPPAPDGADSSVQLAFKVRGDIDAAYVSLIEDSGYTSAFHWHAENGNYVKGIPGTNTYTGVLSTDRRFTAWGPMQELIPGTSFLNNLTVASNVVSLESNLTDNGFNYAFATVERGYALQATWTAPFDGIVRVFDRPAPFVATTGLAAGTAKPFVHEIYRQSTSGTTLESQVIVANSPTALDKDGILVARRFEVTAGDKIILRIANDAIGGTIRVQWHPAVRYETYEDTEAGVIRGKRVTYYGASTPPAARLGETLIPLSGGVPAGTFTAYSGLLPLAGTPLALVAKGPLDLELGSYDHANKVVEFDDVSCLVEFDDVATESALRDEFLGNLTAARDNERYQRDRDVTIVNCAMNTTFVGKGGALETAFVTHPLDVDTGPNGAVFNPGSRPARAADRQDVAFDVLDFTDLDFVDEQTARRANTVTSLDTKDYYKPQTDRWIQVSGEVDAKPGAHLERYRQLGDVEELRRALEQCYIQSQNGVIDIAGVVDPREGAILVKGYDPVTGANAHNTSVAGLEDFFFPHLVMEAPATMVATYVECAKAITAQPSLSGFLDTAKMTAVWNAAATAAQTGVALKVYWHFNGAYGAWEGTWMYLGGYFNDTYGYGAKASWVAVHALDSLPGTWTVPSATTPGAMKSRFLDDFIRAGATHFIDLWEQQITRYASRAGDEMRAWLSYGELFDYMVAGGLPLDPTLLTRIRTIMRESALCALKHQHAAPGMGGAWASHSGDEFYMNDLSGAAGGLSYGPELALTAAGLALHSLPAASFPAERAEMLDVASTLARVSNLHFGNLFGHEMGVEPLFNFNVAAPVEGRMNGAGVFVIEALQVASAAIPVAGMTIGDLVSAPSTFDFTIQGDPAAIASIVSSRSLIGYWSKDTAGNWMWTTLWSPTVQNLTPQIVGGTATFPFSTAALIGVGEIKFRVVAWTPDGGRSVATAYQQW